VDCAQELTFCSVQLVLSTELNYTDSGVWVCMRDGWFGGRQEVKFSLDRCVQGAALFEAEVLLGFKQASQAWDAKPKKSQTSVSLKISVLSVSVHYFILWLVTSRCTN
jgi:hypothetical protein